MKHITTRLVVRVLLAIVSPTMAQAQNMRMEDCAPQWRKVIDGKTFCLLGEPYFTDHTVVSDGRYGAPIALPEAEDRARTERDHGASPYSGHGH